MAPLDALDSRLRRAIQANPRILAALAYGSRTQLPGGVRQDDEFSDLEYSVTSNTTCICTLMNGSTYWSWSKA